MPTVTGRRYGAFIYLDASIYLNDTSPLHPLHMERAEEHVPPLAHAV